MCAARAPSPIKTPDQRLRVFVSSTLGELADERAVVRAAIERLRLTPVMFELGARPHPPRELYRAYLEQSHVFLGLYWERYGWIAPGESVSGLEDEYRLAGDRPRLLYLKHPAPGREPALDELIGRFQTDDRASYKRFSSLEELAVLVEEDLALLLSERFDAAASAGSSEAAAHLSTGPPHPLTPTVGRAADIDEVCDALRSDRRLVTLTGPGGVGKSRLAAEVARLLGSERDAVHFVPLAAVADADRALRTVVDRLGLRLDAAPPTDVLVSHARGRSVLLVLDNVEQIDGIGPAVIDLLARAPDLQVLVTSRQALRVQGEWEHPVTPLAETPAVELFVDRARAASGQFALTAVNAEAVAEIVRRLDGLPLALELAAAQLRVLPPRALLDRLSSALDLPVPAAVDLPARQRTLRATLDWSHALLTAPEQALFARLSAFEGGWTLDAAAAVCGSPDDPEVIETLASLIDKSLVISDRDASEAEPRFRMLETVRAYAVERLATRGEVESVRGRHLVWCRDLAARAQPGLCGPGQQQWVAAMAPERANLRRAVETAFELGDHPAVVEVAWDVVVLYFVRDAVYEPSSWLRRVTEAEPHLDEVSDAKLRALFALTRIHHGDYDGVGDALQGSVGVFRAHGMGFETAVALHQIGFVEFQLRHDVDAAVAALEESSARFADIGHDWGVGLVEAMLGSVFAAEGDLAAAEEHQQRSLEHAQKIHSDQQIVQAIGQLVLIRLLAERYDEALELVAEAAPIIDRGQFRTDGANALDSLAVIAHQRGDHRSAAIATLVAAADRERLGIEPWPTVQVFIDRVRRWVRRSLDEEELAAVARAASDLDLFDTLDTTLRLLGQDGGPGGVAAR